MLEILQYGHMFYILKITVKHSDSISNFVFTLRHARLGYNCIVTRIQAWQTGIQILVEEDSSLNIFRLALEPPQASSKGTRVLSWWQSGQSDNHSPLSNAEIHNEWRYIYTPPPFMACMDQLYLYPRNASEEQFSL
jgi:hypothetical protein